MSRRLPVRTHHAVQQVLDDLDALMLTERHRTMAARGLSQVSWRIYELRRAIAKEIRADGGSWTQVGATMGISRQSARVQWHTVDGELGITDEQDGPDAPRGGQHAEPDQLPGQLSVDDFL